MLFNNTDNIRGSTFIGLVDDGGRWKWEVTGEWVGIMALCLHSQQVCLPHLEVFCNGEWSQTGIFQSQNIHTSEISFCYLMSTKAIVIKTTIHCILHAISQHSGLRMITWNKGVISLLDINIFSIPVFDYSPILCPSGIEGSTCIWARNAGNYRSILLSPKIHLTQLVAFLWWMTGNVCYNEAVISNGW